MIAGGRMGISALYLTSVQHISERIVPDLQREVDARQPPPLRFVDVLRS